MKVKQMIKQLQKLNQEAVTFIHQYDKGSKKTRTFRDAFDGETFSKEVMSISGGTIPVVLIS